MSLIKGTRGRVGGRLLGAGVVGAATLALALLTPTASSAEPASCLSTNPADWPAPSKPYFMIIVDTSGSMGSGVASTNSCGYPNNRIGHARCAVKNTVQAFAGEANFGLASYAWQMVNCNGSTCYSGCQAQFASNDNNLCGPRITEPTLGYNVHSGANIEIQMLQDHYWNPPPDPTNVPSLLSYVDNNCTGSIELAASGNTPLGGALFDMNKYFAGSYVNPVNGGTLPTPIGPATFNGQPAERDCRSLNIILITDGDETCDGGDSPTPIAGGCRSGHGSYLNSAGERLASYEADRLWTNGVTVSGQNFKVRTHVIGFVGASTTALDHIATCGGTGSSYSTANEAQLSAALANIIGGAIKPETCDNTDNNCNGCTDEGYKHYCNENRTPSTNPTQIGECCSAARATCMANYTASISASNPQGDRWWLPCWTPVAADIPQQKWLCVDPGEICDNKDNNCDTTIDPATLSSNTVDEGMNKCGSPLHCPLTEKCDGQDDNCDGIVDNVSSGTCSTCVPRAETCDGCDDDCNGIADDGIAPIACGLPSPANCAGTQTCPTANVTPGGCMQNFPGWTACTNNPQTEVCDGIDNNCNGQTDEGIPPTQCGQVTGLYYNNLPTSDPHYFAQSKCQLGSKPCGGTCTGYVGPGTEVCDGQDDNCDGIVDNPTPPLPGTGLSCNAPCGSGTTACVGGTLVCQPTVAPQPEVCDGIDNDCNGVTDDVPPPPNPGCWNTGNSSCSTPCTYQGFNWCPPTGATCGGLGTLTSPCQAGTLVCAGAQGWTCQGGTLPQPESCDGVDNNCDGQTDNGNMPSPIGDACGAKCADPNVPCPCKEGVNVCQGGKIVCQGGVGPQPEVCNGIDDDCNGKIDDGIPNLGGDCTPSYDTTLYPGDRTKGACKPGHYECDPNGSGNKVCVGGVGPSPETCDGIDNDCDGKTDESGPAPDGIDGTADPNDPSQHIGDSCGSSVGECKPGNLICDPNGQVVCAGGVGPQPETCDCLDNNCNGQVDEDNPAPDGGTAALCSTGKTCVSFNGICQCAAPCGSGEFPCPTGTDCQTVPKSGTSTTGPYCVSDNCGDCTTQTAKDPKTGETICGPTGTKDSLGNSVPLCICKSNSCTSPCTGITCPSGQSCVTSGPAAGNCEPDNNCYFQGCPTGKLCNDQNCVTDPCNPNPCKADEVCKPSSDFLTARCVASCAGVTCKTGEVCKEGQCQATGCSTDCPAGQYCQGDPDAGTAACGPSKCNSDGGMPCANGAYCDPATGACGNNPCEGVVCPSGQTCQNGDCTTTQVDAGPEGSTGGSGGSAGSASLDSGVDSGGGAAGTAGKPTPPKGVWGLATGGGGCACRTAGSRRKLPPAGMLLFGLGVVGVLERRRRRRGADGPQGRKGAGE